jgi:hypothetical protein
LRIPLTADDQAMASKSATVKKNGWMMIPVPLALPTVRQKERKIKQLGQKELLCRENES